MRRSASSIPTNIAEGCGRGSDSDMARFIQIAMGSACELEYQLILSKDLNYLIQSDYELLTNDVQEVKRMLASFLKKLRADS
jgi:four helix bundle protein